MTHICVNKLTIIYSDNGLSPGRRRAVIWTNARILLIWTVGKKRQWNLNRNSYIFIQENVFKKYLLKDRGHFVSATMYQVCIGTGYEKEGPFRKQTYSVPLRKERKVLWHRFNHIHIWQMPLSSTVFVKYQGKIKQVNSVSVVLKKNNLKKKLLVRNHNPVGSFTNIFIGLGHGLIITLDNFLWDTIIHPGCPNFT